MAITGWKEGKKTYYVSNPSKTVGLDASAGPALTTEPMSPPGPGRAVGWAASWLPVLHWRGLDRANLGLRCPGSSGDSLLYHTGIQGWRGRRGSSEWRWPKTTPAWLTWWAVAQRVRVNAPGASKFIENQIGHLQPRKWDQYRWVW